MNEELVGEIQSTKNYAQFSYIPGNRPIKPRHVNRLVKAMELIDLSEKNPAIVNEKNQLIDGQHRLEARKILKRPFYYIVSRGSQLEDVQVLNTYNERWTQKDFIASYASLGNQNFQLLQDFLALYELPITVSCALLLGKKILGGGSHHLRELLQTGEFVVKDAKGAETLASYIQMCASHTEYGVWKSRDFVAALQTVLEQGSWDELYKNMRNEGKKIPRRFSKKEYIRELEIIYNKYKQTNITRFI